jgi:hypothetical protein
MRRGLQPGRFETVARTCPRSFVRLVAQYVLGPFDVVPQLDRVGAVDRARHA